MKKILVISGSPRKKGNTMSIVKLIEDRMKEFDEGVEFSYLFLRDRDLKFCRGCLNCLRRGGTFCPLKDDALDILKEMHAADGLIFASPGYAHQVSASFKNFMDRFMYLDHLPEFVGVPALAVSTVGYDGAKDVPKYIADMSIAWWGCDIVGKLGVAHVLFEINTKYREKVLKQIDTLAGDFHKELTSDVLKRPSLRQYIYFLLNRMETEFCEEGTPGRYEFWKERGWLEGDYYYDTKIGLSRKLMGLLFLRFMQTQAKRSMGKDYKERLAEYY